MELELKKETLCFYEFSTAATAVHEEATETIVPDIDSDAKVFLSGAALKGDNAIVTGSVKVTVLFTPEGENGIRNLEFSLPFNTSLSNKDFEHCQSLFARVHIQSIETKSLNPRKIFTRVLLTVRLQGLKSTKADFCTDISAQSALGIAQMARQETLNLITAYTEKDFTFTDEISIPAGKEAVLEILSCTITPSVQKQELYMGHRLKDSSIVLPADVDLIEGNSGGQYG